MIRLNRRELLKTGLAAGISLVLKGQPTKHKDYLFWGETHDDNINPAIKCIIRNKEPTVALEGIPQGVVTISAIEAYEAAQRKYDLRAQSIDDQILFLARNEFSLCDSTAVLKIYAHIKKPLGCAVDALHNSMLEPGPGWRYARSLLNSGITPTGVEEEAQYQEAVRIATNYFGRDKLLLNLQQCRTNLENAPITSTDERQAKQHLLAFINDIRQYAINQQLIPPNYELAPDRVQTYRRNLENLLTRARTETWMTYLADKTPVALICGAGHLDLAKEYALLQGKTYRVAYDARTHLTKPL